MNKDQKILIVGLGLLGGSYALTLHQAGYYVMGLARRDETIAYAYQHQMIDEGSTDDSLVNKADIIICALYPTIMIDWIRSHAHQFKPTALITDVSGVKSRIVDTIQAMIPNEFISAHPMAGKETSGIEYANTEMFKQANFIIVPTASNTQQAIDTMYQLANILGFKSISELSVDEHDEMIAFLSQLTHVIAVSLMNTHDNSHLVNYTGDSFRDLTRIAKINENMWSELFLLNREKLLNEIDAFSKELNHFRAALDQKDSDEMKRLFIQSSKRRKAFDK